MLTIWSPQTGVTAASAAQDGDGMRHLKCPTRNQKKLMSKWNLNANDWLVEWETVTELIIVHRNAGIRKIIPKVVS